MGELEVILQIQLALSMLFNAELFVKHAHRSALFWGLCVR